MEIENDISVSVVEIKKKNPKIHCRANIIISTAEFSTIAIKGVLVWKSEHLDPDLNDYVNITLPSINSFGKYRPILFFENIDTWKKIKLKIYKECKPYFDSLEPFTDDEYKEIF